MAETVKMDRSESADEIAEIFFRFARSLLDAAQNFVLFALFEGEVVIRQLRIFLLQAAFDFIPVAFDFELGHGLGGLFPRAISRC
jgi:hypothetical protein